MTISSLKGTLAENIYIVVSFLAAAFFVLVLLIPSVSSFPTIFSQLKAKTSELNILRAKSATLNSLITNQASLKSSLKIIDTAIPSKDNVPTLMTEIQRIATDSGVTLKALQFGATALVTSGGGSSRISADKVIKRVLLQAIAEGSFANLQSFLRNLENASRLITVESIYFESKKSGQTVSSTLGLASYFIDSLPADLGVTVDLGSNELKSTLLKLKSLKIYESETTFSGIGKANPFE